MTWNNSIVCFGTRYKPSVGGLSSGLLYADDMKLVVGFALLVYVTLLSLLYLQLLYQQCIYEQQHISDQAGFMHHERCFYGDSRYLLLLLLIVYLKLSGDHWDIF